MNIQNIDRIETSNSLAVRIIDRLEDFYTIRKEWQDLERRSNDPHSYFQSFDWCEKWCRIYGPSNLRNGGRLHIALIYRNGHLAALLPLVRERRRRMALVLRFLGEPLIQYSTILRDENLLDNDEVAVFINKVIDEAKCDAVHFDHMVEGSLLHSSLSAKYRQKGVSGFASMVTLDKFSGGEDYVAKLSRQRRKSRNRKRRKLESLGDLNFVVLQGDDPAFQPMLEASIAQKSVWLKEVGLPEARISDDRVKRLLGELAGTSDRNAGALAFGLTLNGQPIAIEIGFWKDRHYYSYLGSFDWDMGQYSPGKLLLQEAICWAIDNRFETYDLLGHPSEYKTSIANSSVAIAGFAKPKNLIGTGYVRIWKPVVKPTIKQSIKALPTNIRHMLFRAAAPLMGK